MFSAESLTREKIRDFLHKNGRTNFITIARKFKIPVNKNYLLTQFLNNLISNNYIFFDRAKNEFYVQNYIKTIKGEIQINKPHYGFIDDEMNPEDSYFVAKENFNKAYDGDKVEAHVYEYEGKYNAVVINILNHAKKSIIAKLVRTKDGIKLFGFYDKHKYINFKINNLDTFAVKENYLVLVEVLRYHKTYLTVNIVKNICPLDDELVDVEARLNSFDVNLEFPKEVNLCAEKLPDEVSKNELQGRVDFRDELVVTIDGDDTRDFDDAINVKRQGDDFVLSVHIADVSYYVREDDTIDIEALKRGTSIYLADRVLPMLPTKLSNGICSLNPNVDRLAMSAIMTIDKNGNNKETKIVQSVINSKYRLTYSQVNEYYKNKNNSNFSNELKTMLNDALELSKIIKKYKDDEGYVGFEIEEPKIILEGNKVKDIVTKKSGLSENMIEDFMVRANEQVALALQDKKIPLMYRIHETPEMEKVNITNMALNTLGIKTKFPFPITSLDFAKTVRKIEAENNDQFLKIFFLRTMPKAIYSTNNIGHFGLASKHYCHFTSPIRRYPDLTIHRMLRDYYLTNKKIEDSAALKAQLETFAKRNSDSEQEGVTVERATNDIFYAQFYNQKIGTKFRGKISTILKFGMFIELETHVSTLCHITNMFDGKYEFDEETNTLKCKGQKTYKIGDEVTIIICDTNLREGKVDCVLSHNYEQFLVNKEIAKKSVNSTKFNKKQRK
ncbi:exoribonuclease II [Mycoplasmopsis californica]|uniref:Ribonuclease R n=1 Tax=Mycoplasmopsis equigenitalium TaxID=114883 RepID=A0ABY5J228_9BACT|nr:ribonuclease R [Mycoplasmopsis equigenitalium]UUD36774.1 ribonuclease R [Mycoplasmopsis equigenitalium]VEU69928.1 exoribonuclease II [Mycoplasmopsis californica]